MFTQKQIDALKVIVVKKNTMTGDLTRRVLWYLIENSVGGTENVSIVLEVGNTEYQFQPRDIVLVELYFRKLLDEAIYLNTLCELAGTDSRFRIDMYRDGDGKEYKVFSFCNEEMPVTNPRFVTHIELAEVDLNIPEDLRKKKR
jgi:hypothetical protein